jgi:thiol:disulfide interchange protein DsbD
VKKILPFFLLSLPALAQDDAVAEARSARVTARLVSSTDSFVPGLPVEIALRLEMAPEWHVYWENPGDSGESPRVEWRLPAGFEMGAWSWPAPHRIALGPLANYGYERKVLYVSELQTPAQGSPEKLRIEAHAKWLVCKEECIPEEAKLFLDLPRSISTKPSPFVTEFEETKALWPRSVEGWKLSFRDDGVKKIVAEVEAPVDFDLAGQKLELFPQNAGLVEHGIDPETKVSGNKASFGFARASYAPKSVARFEAVLVAHSPQGGAPLVLSLSGQAGAISSSGLWVAILSALLGGLLLNLMPCVLPVLALKVLGIVQGAHRSQSERRKEAFAFGAGVLVSFWLLAGLLLVLRAGGQGLGWGFQLQSPGFVLFLALLFAVMAFQFFGFFSFGDRLASAAGRVRTGSGLLGSFSGGVLMTAVSTPCTAPFMGPALGAALVMPPAFALLVFSSLGVGMALPLFAVALFPNVSRVFPKPGAWMNKLKRWMGVPLLATALWLGWIFALQQGWISQSAGPGDLPWENYSPARLEELRKEGRPIYVDFTASWCLTCQVNKRVVFSSEDVLREMRERNVALVRADWTQRDPLITKALENFGRSGVPLNVVYGPDTRQEPLVLPAVLTPTIVLESLKSFDTRR